MSTLITVIVPVYNVSDYLEKCVDSIISQSYNELEIILIDDGSTDGSGELCDRLKKKDNRIVVCHKMNGGLSDARNVGMKMAHGDFYAFIDSDDLIHKDFFLELMKAQEEYNADIISCEMRCFYDQTRIPELLKIEHRTQRKFFSHEDALKEYLSPKKERIIHHGLCMKIYRKTLFEGLLFEKDRLHEDLYITYQLIDKARKIVYIDNPYYFYYQRNNGICLSYGEKNFLDEAEAYRQIYEYFRQRDEIKDELLQFLIVQYLELLERGETIEKKETIQAVSNEIRRWVRQHVKQCNHYGFVKRFVILASTVSISVYIISKKGYNSIKQNRQA